MSDEPMAMDTSTTTTTTTATATTAPTTTWRPHAFHLNLPFHHQDDRDGLPYITKFARQKAVKLLENVFSLELSQDLFTEHTNNNNNNNNNSSTTQPDAAVDMDDDDDNDDMDDDDDDDDDLNVNPHEFASHTGGPHDKSPPLTLQAFSKKCARLASQFSTLESLKHGGISTLDTCRMILHLLRLVTCTWSRQDDTGQVVLHYETVGYLQYATDAADAAATPAAESHQEPPLPDTIQDLSQELDRDFCVPSPAREVLFMVLINLLSNKGPLRAVSNGALFPPPPDDDATSTTTAATTTTTTAPPDRFLLILHWKVLLRMLLRTAPYLDEHQVSKIPVDSSSRHATILRRTVQLIRDARHFFDQGILSQPQQQQSSAGSIPDQTALELWDMVRTDALFHSHTHACYRATIILYLFLPSRCTSQYYQQVMPQWWESWTNIDRCPEFDFLWLALFCRARKYIHDAHFDWTPIRKRLLTNSQYWLQLPIGGAALDKSFPRAMNPRSRSCPPRLKLFVGASGAYEEGIDFVAKVAKLLVAGLGTGGYAVEAAADHDKNHPAMSQGTNDVLRFLSFATPYFNPSNLGSWTFTLGAFLHYFAYELTGRIGAAAGITSLSQSHPALARELAAVQPGPAARPIPPHEIVALLHALLLLCQQSLYSKNGHVGRAGEAAMLYLIQIDPIHTTPAFIDFATRALDISAVNLSHQAPAALSALTRLIQPALRSDASIWLVRLPEMLRLSLAGIDSNDQNKTLRTLILYRSLTSWVPVGGKPDEWPTLDAEQGGPQDGTMRVGKDVFETMEKLRKQPEYLQAIERLPETSLMRQGEPVDENDTEMRELIVAEAMSALSDWAIEFLDRVFGLLRASGEREKQGKTVSGVANQHSSADVHAARNFSRVLKETVMQVFAAMDDQVHKLAVRTVCQFLQEETHPSAAKDTSFLCQATAAARENRNGELSSPGLDSLILILADDLPHHSTKTLVYRLRCLAGAVRLAGQGVVKHRTMISDAIDFALSSHDRHLFKTGCKLLRHTLSTLCESYPIATDSKPRAFLVQSKVCLGRSAQLHGDAVKWHIPDASCVEFAHELLGTHVLKTLNLFCENTSSEGDKRRSRMLNSVDVQELRRFLRVVRYSIRGGASLMLDQNEGDLMKEDVVPYEMAAHRLLSFVSDEIRASILSIRMRLASFLIVLSAVVASDTLYPDWVNDLSGNDVYRKNLPLIAADPKVCKETCDIALLLLTRRGASFRSQEARTIWKAQKQLATDFAVSAQVDQMAEALQSASLYGEGPAVLYKDGEDAGKTVPRRLLVARILLFHDSLQRNSSFEVPRRLRRLNREKNLPRTILFSVKDTLPEMLNYLESILASPVPHPLDAYEGITDGLCALSCHSNTQVRASAISVTDYATTRFAWLLAPRVSRLMSAIALEDKGMNGKFGFPACSNLVDQVNQLGKRKRLAEAVKGVCSILSFPRAIKHLMGTEKMRLRFARMICGTDGLISLLPAEEVQKIVHYLQAVFAPFRTKVYYLPRITRTDRQCHLDSLSFANDILAEKTVESNGEDSESVAVHWRKLLLGCWFLLTQIDGDDDDEFLHNQIERTWETCFRILETESGQPLQRVGLGLFGRLAFLAAKKGGSAQLEERMKSESFCKVLGDAIVFDHMEDTSVGGGHGAQWSAGVEDILRDSARNIAPRTLFPFQRTSQSLGSFRVSHPQLVEHILGVVSNETANLAIGYLLSATKEMAAAPPNEDQRNLQIASAEIFGGICGYYIRHSGEDLTLIWKKVLLPHLDDVMSKIPFSLSTAYFDAIRYALQFAAPRGFYALTEWLVDKIETTLWQPQAEREIGGDVGSTPSTPSNHVVEGFTAQSKWLYLISAVLIEMDDSEVDGAIARSSWYASHLVKDCPLDLDTPNSELEVSWNLVIERLLPRLTAALGHPFDSCRDHIARCLFRICYCHRKRARLASSRAPSRSSSMVNIQAAANIAADLKLSPGSSVVGMLATLERSDGRAFQDRYNALSTARRFMSYCVHLGEAKFEFSEFVIPLLPVAFEALTSTVEAEIGESATSSAEENAAKRALEAEVIKAYRYMIAEVSVSAVISYGRETDISRVLNVVEVARQHEKWQVRHASANFLRCFQGAHKFLFSEYHATRTMAIVAELLADERREVFSAAMAALTGILAASPETEVAQFVTKYSIIARKSKMKRRKKGAADPAKTPPLVEDEASKAGEEKRAKNQQTSVFFLCAAVMAHPYDTPAYVPAALAAISKHSFEGNAPLGVRDIVKKCCAEYKKTHMSDNWEVHRQAFSQEQLEALEDVVSSPHYYA